MEKLIKNTDLNINSWLINWGYMNGYLQDGQIQTTKFTIFNQWLVIIVMLLNITRFSFLLFTTKDSQISKQLGEWSYFVGPRIMVNGISAICAVYILFIILFFQFSTRNLKKMFYWLNKMEYDIENQCFFRMNLNESDSKMFNKRILILIITLKSFTYLFIIFFVLVSFSSIYKYINDYHLNYFISIIIYLPAIYYCCGYAFGLPVILYLVSHKLIA